MRVNLKIALAITVLICSFSTIFLIGIVPMVQGKKIKPNTEYTYKHNQENGFYRLEVEQGHYYLRLNFFDYDIEPEIQLFTNSFKIRGTRFQLDSRYPSNFLFRFEVKIGGRYYLTIKESKGAIFRIYLEKGYTEDHYYAFSHRYVNAWKLFIIISSLILIGMGVVITRRGYRQKIKEEHFRKTWKYCPICNSLLQKNQEYCIRCGYTFLPPKIQNSY